MDGGRLRHGSSSTRCRAWRPVRIGRPFPAGPARAGGSAGTAAECWRLRRDTVARLQGGSGTVSIGRHPSRSTSGRLRRRTCACCNVVRRNASRSSVAFLRSCASTLDCSPKRSAWRECKAGDCSAGPSTAACRCSMCQRRQKRFSMRESCLDGFASGQWRRRRSRRRERSSRASTRADAGKETGERRILAGQHTPSPASQTL